MSDMPAWDVPDNLDELLAEEDGEWEDARWDPILLTVMTGTVYKGREIPYSWQIEFEPFDAGDEANMRLAARGYERDGYGWGEAIYDGMNAAHPALVDQLHLEDCEQATCVIWVESEETCRVLMQETWKLMFGE